MISKDSVYTGLITGIIAPVLAFLIYYYAKFSSMTIMELIDHIILLDLMSAVISLSLVANLLSFFIFIWLKADQSAKGVLLATFIYGAVIVALIYLV